MKGPKEPPVALDSNSGTNFTIPNPPSPTSEKIASPTPPAKPVTMNIPPQKPPRDPELENFENGGAAGPSHNLGKKKKGPTLQERMKQQETQFQSFVEKVLTQLDVLQRRLDKNPQQQMTEAVMQG
ncbi:hypothetical protein ACLOJK_037566 [Asimina triloba]